MGVSKITSVIISVSKSNPSITVDSGISSTIGSTIGSGTAWTISSGIGSIYSSNVNVKLILSIIGPHQLLELPVSLPAILRSTLVS